MCRFTFLLLTSILSVVWTLDAKAGDPIARPKSDAKTEGVFVVHEWGTFTTFSGSDGVLLDFRPLAAEHSDLPPYVLDRGSYSQNRLFTKNRIWGRVRMETPVTYFYTDRVRTVDVRVDFPEGLLTEFYPPAREMMPTIDESNIFGKGELIGKSRLSWLDVDLIPIHQVVPSVEDEQHRRQLSSSIVNRLLPHAAGEQHYAAARETNSSLVHVREKVGQFGQQQSYFEKFLFYRGVGKFQLPIQAEFIGDDVVITNAGELPISSAIMIHVDGQELHATKIDQVVGGQSLPFDQLQRVNAKQLADLVQQSLVAEGLYEEEAASMVKTWQQSWFTENGTRVLYIVPGPTTEELLPLQVTPQPQEMLRVLVGRMEIMSPQDEQRIMSAVAASSKARAAHNAKPLPQGKRRAPYGIPESIRDYGRMAEPALARVSKISTDPVIRKEAEQLMAQFRQ